MKPLSVLKINQFRHSSLEEDFHINTLENHLATRHKDIAEPHSHNFYLAILFTHGSGVHEIDFSSYEVKPGALFFLNPGQTHHWHLSPDVKGYIFFHTRDFYETYYTANELAAYPFYFSMHNKPVMYLSPNSQPMFTNYFSEIYEEYTEDRPLKKTALMSLISLTYTKSAREYETVHNDNNNNSHSTYYQKFRQFESLVEENRLTQKLPGFYAEKLSVTLRHLNRIAQAVTGKTATDVILDRVLLEAKKELVLHRGNFKNVADLLGYDDYAYFSRLFKNKTGKTPSQFVKQYIISTN